MRLVSPITFCFLQQERWRIQDFSQGPIQMERGGEIPQPLLP